eukprot:scaffold1805_cov248-Pinguiococcus_pyrenoidosus.AAC.4
MQFIFHPASPRPREGNATPGSKKCSDTRLGRSADLSRGTDADFTTANGFSPEQLTTTPHWRKRYPLLLHELGWATVFDVFKRALVKEKSPISS